MCHLVGQTLRVVSCQRYGEEVGVASGGWSIIVLGAMENGSPILPRDNEHRKFKDRAIAFTYAAASAVKRLVPLPKRPRGLRRLGKVAVKQAVGRFTDMYHAQSEFE